MIYACVLISQFQKTSFVALFRQIDHFLVYIHVVAKITLKCGSTLIFCNLLTARMEMAMLLKVVSDIRESNLCSIIIYWLAMSKYSKKPFNDIFHVTRTQKYLLVVIKIDRNDISKAHLKEAPFI